MYNNTKKSSVSQPKTGKIAAMEVTDNDLDMEIKDNKSKN
jgi:hypothetical protein